MITVRVRVSVRFRVRIRVRVRVSFRVKGRVRVRVRVGLTHVEALHIGGISFQRVAKQVCIELHIPRVES